ncbi:MAG TPA: hypothetical protein VFC09_10255 [Candidatus Dormibacteraeota bacterium]|nr:hypothetical protein [Candidatus Dormibacteraeota bacterium]
MSGVGPTVDDGGQGLGNRSPVTGTSPRHDRVRGTHRDLLGRAAMPASRRDAVLRVLLEAYRRDAGPAAFDAD